MDLWRIQGMSMQDRVMSLFPYRIYYLVAKIQIWGQSDTGISLRGVGGEENSFKGILGRIHLKYSWSEFGQSTRSLQPSRWSFPWYRNMYDPQMWELGIL